MFQCDNCTSCWERICEHKSPNKFPAFPETFRATLLLTAASIIIKANMSSAVIISLLSITRTYLQIGCEDNKYFWLSCRHSDSGGTRESLFEKEGSPVYTYFCFSYRTGNLQRGCMRFRVLFIENQYFPFLRMQNELLLRWALCGDWRLSLRHHSSEDFPKDIYFFSPCS